MCDSIKAGFARRNKPFHATQVIVAYQVWALDRAAILRKNTVVPWRSWVAHMKSEDCRERASQCFHLADTARTDQARSTFNNFAQHWLRLAEELEHDPRLVERSPVAG